MEQKNNIFFIITIILVSIIIIMFNIVLDPYELRGVQTSAALSYFFPRNQINLFLKATKNNKYKTLLIGGSNSASMWDSDLFKDKNIATISISKLTFKQMYEILKVWTEIHQETNLFLFSLEYLVYFEKEENPLPVYTSSNYNLKDLYYLSFCYETTEKSLKKLFLNKTSHNQSFITHPKWKLKIFDIEAKEKNNNFEYIDKIIELLKQRNIDIICFIPPYHAWSQADIYNSHLYEQFKILIHYITSKNISIYNFATINKYTSKSLLDDNFLYFDIWHPNEVFGKVVFNSILSKDIEHNSDLYEYITKNNIQKMLQSNENKLKNYIKQDKDFQEEFSAFDYGPDSNDWNYTEIREIKDISKFRE